MNLIERVERGMATAEDAALVDRMVKLACFVGLNSDNKYARKDGAECWNEALRDSNVMEGSDES